VLGSHLLELNFETLDSSNEGLLVDAQLDVGMIDLILRRTQLSQTRAGGNFER
jgi:hypothetical protein